ncbi:quercetin 2,3-dioxygenase [Coleofasciculus sp.]|uniref:quercetin 2,3-dioxygenase n=1 Tax=Coleofasciculus sp. TaxID=3100458 RepID=UPI003A3878B9
MSFLPTGDKLPIVLQPDDGKLIDVLGDTVAIKITGEDTDGVYTVLENVSPPQGGPPLHLHHREDEAFYVLEGEFEVQCGENKIRAVPGSFVLAPREIPHTFRNISSDPSKVLIMVTPAGIEKFFEELSELPKQGPPDIKKVEEIAQRYEIEFILHEEA